MGPGPCPEHAAFFSICAPEREIGAGMLDSMHDLSGAALSVVVCGALTAFAWAGVLAMRWARAGKHRRHADNDLVAAFLSAFGVLYGLILGLIAVEVYSNHDEVDATVAREAAVFGGIYRNVSAYPDPERSDFQRQMRTYGRFVIDTAWPAQRRGEIVDGGAVLVNELSRVLHDYEPASDRVMALHTQTLSQLDEFLQLRRLRFHYVQTGLPSIMWTVVICGSLLNLAMSWFFVSDSLRLHLALSGALATIIGLMIVLIALGDWPFSGELAISSEAYEDIFQSVMADPDA